MASKRAFAKSFGMVWLGLLVIATTEAATFTVDSTADTFDVGNTTCASPCTLRQAITVSNDTLGTDAIVFDIPGAGEQVITITAPMPTITESVAIHGYTQPGAVANTSATVSNAQLRIRLTPGPGLPAGTRALATCAANTFVSGLSFTGFNGGQFGIGTQTNGTACGGSVVGTSIQGNFFGLATDGNSTPLVGNGIIAFGAVGSLIGGSQPADRNVFGGNTVALSLTNASTGNQVLGNLFGMNASDTAMRPNQVAISFGSGSSNNVIGSQANPNVLAGNGTGILTGNNGNNNQWTGNLFRANSPGMAVDLHGNGAVNANDTNDTDAGFNGLQNFPNITNAVLVGADLQVTGQLDVGNASALDYELSVHATDRCDETGHGEGEIFLGAVTRSMSTSAETFTISLPYSGPTDGRRAITMLARHPTNGSSEFSACFRFQTGAPLVVNRTDDGADGICDAAHCTLRDAMLQAAGEPGHDSIHFAIPGAGPHRIVATSAFPMVIQPITIDGYTQPGASVNTHPTASNAVLKVIVDASTLTQPLLSFQSTASVVRGLSIVQTIPGSGSILQSSGNPGPIIEGNWFGVEPDGVTVTPGQIAYINNASNGLRIGGADVSARNVIAGATNTAVFASNDSQGTNTVIENNLFGLLPDGVTAARNVTSISALSNNANPMTIRGNTFGCANTHLSGAGTLVENNRFGTTIDGESEPLGACNNGRTFARSNARFVGNRIASRGSNGRGIEVGATITGVVLDRNVIIDTTQSEIDLGSDGHTPNDALDADAGANNRQNFPVFTDAERVGEHQVEVDGSLNSLPNTSFRIQFFADESVRRITGNLPFANARFVSDEDLVVTTDTSGNAAFVNRMLNFPGSGTIGAISATATRLDAGGQSVETSELGPAFLAYVQGPASFVVTNTATIGPGSFTEAMLQAEAHPDVGTDPDVVTFAIPGTGPHVITPAQSVFAPTGRIVIDGYTQPGSAVNTDSTGTNAQITIEIRNASLQLEASPSALVRGVSLSTSSAFNQPLLRLGNASVITGTFVGVRSDGMTSAAATTAAAYIDCPGSCGVIGGTPDGDRNLIANPTSGDVAAIRSGGAQRSVVRGNLIGMRRDGVTALVAVGTSIATPSATTARAIQVRANVTPGDDIVGNVIGGGLLGIRVEGQSARIEGNLIGGRRVAGTPMAFRNGAAGIWIPGGEQHVVIENEIRSNGGDGIDIGVGAIQVGLIDNMLVANTGLGIDLGSNGVTANDVLDADSGPNGFQNFPALASAVHDSGGITVTGTLAARPSTPYRLRFCLVQTPDASTFGECDMPVPSASLDVTTAADGTAAFTTPAFADFPGMTAISAIAAELVSGRESSSELAQNTAIRRAVDVSVIASPEPSLAGQPFTVTATVNSRVGGASPSGTVTVTTTPNVGGCSIVSLSAGIGSCQITPSVSGPVTLLAQYNGSTTTVPASGTAVHHINRVGTTLTITNDAPDPSTPGGAFTVTFVITAVAGTPVGDVTVTASGGGSCTGGLASGQGFCVLTPTGTGNLELTAEYPGSAIHLPAQDTEAHSVGASSSTTTIQSISPSPSVYGQSITVVAAATAQFGTPSGPITVSDGAGATCEISGGSGSCQLVPTNVGNDISIRAEFTGNAGHTGSFGTSTHVVNRAEVTLAVATPFRADTGEGQPAQFAPMRVPMSIAAAAPGAGTPTGTIIVESVLGDELCVIVLPALFCDLVPLSPGTTDFTASYVGDSRFNERLEEFEASILPAPLFSDGFECEVGCP